MNLFETAGIDDWQFTQGVVITNCKYSLPSIFVLIDGYWVEARSEDYMYDYSGNGRDCVLFIMSINSPMNIFGMPAYVDYYTIHDPTTGLVSWAPHTNSNKSDLEPGNQPTGKYLEVGNMQGSLGGAITGFGLKALFTVLAIIWWRYQVYAWINDAISNLYLRRLCHAAYFVAMMFAIYYLEPLLTSLIFPSA